MPEPILDTRYWARRLREAQRIGRLHEAVFRCPLDRWQAIEAKHREILAREIAAEDWILDAGCGWGRLLDLMPPWWWGRYEGIDLSPDFIALARQLHPRRAANFICGTLDKINAEDGAYDWAVMVSIRPMVKRNLGDEAWARMEGELRRVARKLLYLEYDPDDPGLIE